MKTLLALLLILNLFSFVSAQQSSLLDELEKLEKFGSEKLGGLKSFVSNKEDVAKAVGTACQSTCDYDENWRLAVGYVGNWGKRVDGQYYRPKAEIQGKLSHVWLFPKLSFMIKSPADLPAGVTCRSSNGVHEAPAIKNRICTDRGRKLSFYIAAETTSDGKYVDGGLVRVAFLLSTADYDSIWELIPPK